MNYGELLKRAARITWRYKILWIFGILLALTGGGGGTNGGGGANVTWTTPSPVDPSQTWGPEFWAAAAGMAALCCCLILILVVVAVIVQYVARTALYRSVDKIEETGTSVSWREGFRLGWSNRALRMFLLDFLVGVAVFFASMILLALGATPLLLLLLRNDMAIALGIAATVGLEILVIMAIVVSVVVISVMQQFWRREIALADRSVGEALSSGTRLIRRKAGDVGIFWLLMAGIGFLFFLVVIPIVLMVGFAGVAAGGGLGYAVYALTESSMWAVLAGLPVFLLIVFVPLAIVQGIYLVFESSAWTLAYRDVVKGAAQTAIEPLPSV